MEKGIIFDPNVAHEIVSLIQEHSEGQKSAFIDADAGLCLIAREWQKICPNRQAIILQRDQAFAPLTEKLLKYHPQLSLKNHNILEEYFVSDPDSDSSRNEFRKNRNKISFRSITHEFRNGWDNPVPGYTLFATATHMFCKGKIHTFSITVFPWIVSTETCFFSGSKRGKLFKGGNNMREESSFL